MARPVQVWAQGSKKPSKQRPILVTGGAAAELDVSWGLFQVQISIPSARTDGLRRWDERRHCSGIV